MDDVAAISAPVASGEGPQGREIGLSRVATPGPGAPVELGDNGANHKAAQCEGDKGVDVVCPKDKGRGPRREDRRCWTR